MRTTTRKLQTRNNPDELSYRKMSVAGKSPKSLDRESRSVDVVAATETPAMVMDWERWEIVSEVLLMSGAKLPKSRQVPLLDSHSRYSSADVLGSARELRTEGPKLLTKALFSSVPRAEETFTKVEEGHLTDFSIGYRVNKSFWIPEGQSQTIEGRVFKGPVKVATDWTLKELSITPIGADDQAKARSGHQKERVKVDPKLRKFLESRGLDVDATEEQAWAFLEKLELKREESKPKDAPQPPIDEAAIREEGARNEQGRILEIRATCDKFNCSDMAGALIKEGRTIEEARKAVLDKIEAQFEGGRGYRPPVDMQHDERDKFRSASFDSLLHRGGISLEKPAPGAMELVGYSLRELAREALRVAGHPVSGNPLEMVGRALTTSDFPLILANAANKFLMEGYQIADETWPIWCAVGSVSDFKQNSAVRPGEYDDLEEVKEDGEYKHGSRTEGKEVYQIATYGKLYAISRQAIINDDLGVLTDTPQGHGEAAARKVGDVAYAVVTANAAMGDSIALFEARHNNLDSGAVPGVASIGTGIKLMKMQKDMGGKRRLNIRPIFFIAPVSLEGAAEVFFNSGNFADSNTVATDSSLAATRTNPYAGARFTRVYEPRLDDSDTYAWYLAGPKGKTVKLFFLNGNQEPYMEVKQGWNVDGVQYKVRIDAAAKAMDWRALVKNPGH